MITSAAELDVTTHSHPEVPALTTLSDDERLFRDSVYEFADREIRPLVREMDEHAKIPARAHRQAVRPRRDGHRNSRELRRRRRQLLPLRPGRRGALAGRPVDRRAGRRAEHARHQRAAPLGQRRHQAPLPAEAGGERRSARTRCRKPARAATRSRWRRARSSATATGSITGRKLWITNANEADLFIVFANVNPEAGYRGITAFLVERGFARLHRRQEGRQARHPREQHLRAAVRGLPRAARQRARRSRQGLQGRDRDAERGAHRHRRADDRPRAGRARSHDRLHEGPQAVRQGDRRVPGRAAPDRARRDRDRSRAPAGLQRGAPARRRPAVPDRSGDVQALLVGGRRARRRRSPSTCSAATAS